MYFVELDISKTLYVQSKIVRIYSIYDGTVGIIKELSVMGTGLKETNFVFFNGGVDFLHDKFWQ